jgi:hypothetical protein
MLNILIVSEQIAKKGQQEQEKKAEKERLEKEKAEREKEDNAGWGKF